MFNKPINITEVFDPCIFPAYLHSPKKQRTFPYAHILADLSIQMPWWKAIGLNILQKQRITKNRATNGSKSFGLPKAAERAADAITIAKCGNGHALISALTDEGYKICRLPIHTYNACTRCVYVCVTTPMFAIKSRLFAER